MKRNHFFLLVFLFFQASIWLLANLLVVKKTIILSKQKQEIESLADENRKLRKKVYLLSSLTSIKKRAEEQGFLPVKGIVISGWKRQLALSSDYSSTVSE